MWPPKNSQDIACWSYNVLRLCYFCPLGDSTSVATEYSLKFDESMTEDEIEERSFRSLLPSEAHRRGTIDKKSRHHEESEDDGANHNIPLVSGAHTILKVNHLQYSSRIILLKS